MSQSVSEASKNLSAACIIVISKTGRTAINISKFRPKVPIVTIVPNAKAGRLLQVCLLWLFSGSRLLRILCWSRSGKLLLVDALWAGYFSLIISSILNSSHYFILDIIIYFIYYTDVSWCSPHACTGWIWTALWGSANIERNEAVKEPGLLQIKRYCDYCIMFWRIQRHVPATHCHHADYCLVSFWLIFRHKTHSASQSIFVLDIIRLNVRYFKSGIASFSSWFTGVREMLFQSYR